MKYIGLFDEKEDIVTKEKLETKQDIITGAATTITDDNLTASHALVSDASGKVVVSPVTSTELSYLDGVTSSVQTQLDSKAIDADVVHKTGDESISGEKTFIAPKNISGTEQTTTKFNTSNGGAVIVGKEGNNSGTMLRLDQVDGTPRLRFRASAAAGAMIWEQPEHGAQLYIDLGDHGTGGDYHRISFPSGYGVLALQSDVNDKVPKSRTINGHALSSNIDLTAADVGALPDTTAIPTKTSQLDNDSGFITSAPVTSVNTKTGAVSLSASDVGAQPTITVNGIIKGDGAGNLSAQDTVAAELVDLPTVPTKVSELTNDANYITAAQAPVQSVNNKTGAVSLTASDVSAIPSTLTGTAGQVLTKTADGQEWKDSPIDENSVLLKNVDIIMPASTYWYSVCYGNGKFVAVALDSTVAAYSTDGINWTQATLPTNTYWCSVCYGDGKFVAINSNGNIAAYSTDGINWTQTTMPVSSNWRSVCYGNGKFVAVAYDSDIAVYSTDGINWTQATMPGSREWRSVCYGNGKFVAVCSYSMLPAYSTDAINWTQATMPVSSKWDSVCYGNGKFVAVALDSTVAAYSTDGINWTQATLPTSAKWQSVCYGNDKFVAVAHNSSIAAYSTDGINWTQATLPTSAKWQSVCYGNDKFVAVAYGSDIAVYSTDGITWSSTTKALQYPDGTDIHEQVKEALQLPEIPSLPTATKITLTVVGWDSTAKTQSVTVTGVSADATKQEIRVMPVNAALDSPYIAAGVQCVAQAANSLTFGCETVPTEAIEVYVVMQGINYLV